MSDGALLRAAPHHSENAAIRILGTELDGLFKYMVPGIQRLGLLPRAAVKAWARRFGWSLSSPSWRSAAPSSGWRRTASCMTQ